MPSKKEFYILIVLFAIAFVRFLFFQPMSPPYESAIDKIVKIEGVLVSPPDIRLNNVRLTLQPEQNSKKQESNILAVIDRVNINEEVRYGDRVKVIGTLSTPKNFITTAGKEFNYERYLANQDTYFIIKARSMEIISHGNGNYLKSLLFLIRDSFTKNIEKVLNPPESDLASGLVLGARGGFDNEMRDRFVVTGAIHIIALSGYNVTIVAFGVMKILGFFFIESVSIIFGILFIILFIIMSGSSATAIRAGIMASIMLIGKMTGRTYDAGRALVIAALSMVAYDPRIVLDISFELSCLATFGILFITPKVLHLLNRVRFLPIRFGLREVFATTLSATIAVLPLLLYATGILSLVSLPANILILPIIPWTMLLIFIVGMIGFILPTLALPFAYITHLLLHYILSVITFFSSLPFASLTIQSFPLPITIILYVFIFWWGINRTPEKIILQRS